MKKIVPYVSIILIFVGVFWLLFAQGASQQQGTNKPSDPIVPTNTVEVVSSVSLPAQEKDALLTSIDGFMNQYRLPSGIENSYKVVIDSRLRDSLKIIINPEDEYWDSKTIIYARKVDGLWKVDPNGGPWCTLAEFDKGEC